MCDELNNIENIYNKIIKKYESINANHMVWSEFIPIKSIDGIDVEIEIHLSKCSHNNVNMEFRIYDYWRHKSLYREQIDCYEILGRFIHDDLPKLKYHTKFDLLTDDLNNETPMHLFIGYQLYKEIPKCDNLKTTIEECSVCMELCKTTTSCGHPLCCKCETKIKDKSCPICRNRYRHYGKNMECDSDEED